MSRPPETRSLTDVVVGIVTQPDGQVLLGQRPTGKPYAGWWEFPGGKVEPGESLHEAIARELHEELGLRVTASHPWLVRHHAYEHAHVRLHFRRIRAWQGQPESREGQAFGWCTPPAAGLDPLLPATVPLMRLLTLPPIYGISAAGVLGADVFLARLDDALSAGLRLVQFREPALAEHTIDDLLDAVLLRCRHHGASVLVNSRHGLGRGARADGVHLTSADLARAAAGELPGLAEMRNAQSSVNQTANEAAPWLAASCHDAQELALAASLGADFAVLSPVLATRSHPQARTLGWAGFAEAAAMTPIPVYALGGLQSADAGKALDAGAHGVAMIAGLFG